MLVVVKKFGGASVDSIDRIHAVADQLVESRKNGEKVIAVVSAMFGETDRLIHLAEKVMKNVDRREYDALVCSGEQVTAALLAMALKERGIPAKSMLAHQVRVETDNAHKQARIQKISGSSLIDLLEEDILPVVAGFQGISAGGDLTTLGRGGTDLTAVAIAAAVDATCCQFFKDVDGVFTADPSKCRDARLIKRTSYEEMMEITSSGAKILQTRAVLLANNLQVRLQVRSFDRPEKAGTEIISEEDLMEKPIVSAITLDKNEARISVRSLPDRPGIAADIFSSLSARQIFVDMIVHNHSPGGHTGLAFTVPNEQAQECYSMTKNLAEKHGWGEVSLDPRVAKVSAIGVGMRTHSGVASEMFSALASENINIIMIGTSEIRISCLIEEKYAELALQTLHEAFQLGSNASRPTLSVEGHA